MWWIPEEKIVADFRFPHSLEGWTDFRERIKAFPNLAVTVETRQGVVVEKLLECTVTIYPVHPTSAQRYRDRKVPSANKTDHTDAWSLADALRVDRHGWQLPPADSLTQELRLLCRDEVGLIEQRTMLIAQLRQTLYEYYPASLEAFTDWTCPHAWAFVEAFPTPSRFGSGGKRKWNNFLHAHKLYRPETYDKRIACFERAKEFAATPPVTSAKSQLALVKVLQALQTQIDQC